MNIIELARAAGFEIDCASLEWHRRIERFAALVRAAALEEAAQKCDELWQDDGTAYDCREAIRALKEERSRLQNTPSSGESHEDSLKSHDEALLRQALEALEWHTQGKAYIPLKSQSAITALRAALAEPTSGDYALGYVEGFNDACKPKAEPQEPVAWQWLDTANFRKKLPADANKAEWNPLYAAPQPRKRLTGAEIDAIWRTHLHRDSRVRAIEAAVWGDGK